MQMQRHSAEGRVVGVREGVDDGVQAVAADYVVVEAGGGDEGRVLRVREEGVGEVAEELLEQARDGVDVVEEGFGVAEVDFGGVWGVGVSLLFIVGFG